MEVKAVKRRWVQSRFIFSAEGTTIGYENCNGDGGKEVADEEHEYGGSKDQSGSKRKRSSMRKEKGIAFNPIHVFEDVEGDLTTLDWEDWVFFESTVIDGLDYGCSPVYEGSVDSLNFDNFLNSSNLTRTSLYKNTNVCSVPEKAVHGQIKAEDCLWTDKYQPQNAKQMCGNADSVKSINEWLHLWHKRCSLTSRSCIDEDYSVVQNIDPDYQQSDSDTDSGEENLKNVLLVTGPVGSGKSAAIYACARDQGFQIIEKNTSDWRDGDLVKKRLGGTVRCHSLNNKVEYVTNSENKSAVSKIFKALCEKAHHVDDQVKGVIQMLALGAWPKVLVHKALLLFEDVDATIHEDDGLITAIQQLAKIAKMPIILTSNSDNLVLPKKLDRLELSFSLPSMQELLGLASMICGEEKATMHPCLIERFVNYCKGDIRKTIMLLQFWCRGQTLGRGNKMHVTYWPMLFDIDAGHRILPRVIHWGHPSHLSDLVTDEINKSLTLMEKETHGLMEDTNIVQDLTGNNIQDQRIDLNKYVTAEEKTINRGLLFGYRMCDLISETDLLLKDCQARALDSLGSSEGPCENPHSYNYSDNQLEMCSILGQHGICFYSKEIASLGSTNISDLASEMVLSSLSSVALGKLASQDQRILDRSNEKNPEPSTSKSDSCLSNILKSVVPSRSYLSAKGAAFHEYTSTLSQISRYEDSRLSECSKRKQRRARHYLSFGMSSEEISLLRQYSKSYQTKL